MPVKPSFSIIADDKDVTKRVNDRLLSLTVSDYAGLKSDAVEISVDNRDFAVDIPRTGANLQVSIGYGDNLHLMGLYEAADIELMGPPHAMRIRAYAASFNGKLKAPKSQSHDQISIGDLVAKIARDDGYEARVSPSLAGMVIPHVDQTAESDMSFLMRLADSYGATFKPAGGYLIFLDRTEDKSASGKALVPAHVSSHDFVGSYRYSATGRGRYDGVKARWHDMDAAMDVTELAGSDGIVYELTNGYPNRDAAIAAAKAKLKALQRGTATISFDVVGNPILKAEIPMRINGAHPVISETPWKITSAVHRISNNGYTTEVEANTS